MSHPPLSHAPLDADELQRYHRHLILPEIGDDGQMFLMEFKGCTHKEHGAA